ncbi:hypothetical protein ACIHDR_43410 [Nocardia sp. NPDC052278]|uniref:hypothetical protein n=1 Tax=unclassified Nocardia TaxID=2637762 RepID=UPI003694D892
MTAPASDGSAASAVQLGMLKVIQNVTADVAQLADGPSGGELRKWRNNLRGLSVASQLVEEQARAIGVPDTWITVTKNAGNTGARWSGGEPLPPAAAVDREQLLAHLREQVALLYDMTATHTVCVDRFGAVPGDLADRFHEHLRLQWARVAMVAIALEVTETEVAGWWFTSSDAWGSVLGSTRDQAASQLLQRWRTHTKTTAVSDAHVRVEALNMAGISLSDAATHQLPPRPGELIKAAETAWLTGARSGGMGIASDLGTDGATAISDVVDAALPGSTTRTWQGEDLGGDTTHDTARQPSPIADPGP